MKKPDLTKLKKGVQDVKENADKLKGTAMKTVESVKKGVQTGVSTTKHVAEQAQKFINRDTLSHGIDLGAQGTKILSKGAKLASKGADTVASSLDKASKNMKNMSNKLKK